MANQDVRVSALQSASTLSTEDLALATVVDELSETGYTSKKITEGAKASQYMEAFTFANLNTSAKTIVGAINEAATTGGSDEFIIHMTDTTVTETAADIIDAFDNGSEIWLESQITGEALKARLPLLAYISDSNSLVLRFSGITYSNNRYRYCDVQMIRSPEQILGKQAINVTFAVIDDASTSSSSVWSSQKTASELAGKAEIDDTAIDTDTAWSSSQIVSLLPTESASGAVASFETPLTLPLVSHNVTIEPVQAGTGDPSPINDRPISGWSAVNVTRCGTNLCDEIWETGSIDNDTGANVPDNNNIRMVHFIRCQSGESVYIRCFNNVILRYYFYDMNKSFILGGTTSSNGSVVTVPNGAYFFRVRTTANYGTTYDNDISVNYPATETDYHAYVGETVEIDLDGTVYGGELDVTSGVLKVTWRGVVLDGNSGTWQFQSLTQQGYLSDILSSAPAHYIAGTVTYMCDKLNPVPNSRRSENVGNFAALVTSGLGVGLSCEATTLEDFVTWIANNPVTFVYELATPVEITLTPEQINTLKGVNNIWADTGDTAVEYKQDIQTYIDNRLSSGTRSLSLAKAPVETKEETKQEEQEGDENVDR